MESKKKSKLRRVVMIVLKSPVTICVLIALVVLFILRMVGTRAVLDLFKRGNVQKPLRERHESIRNPEDDKKAGRIDKAIAASNNALKELLK